MNEQTRTPITDVRTVGVPVTDQDRALDFYLDKLGFEERLDIPVEQFGGRSAPDGWNRAFSASVEGLAAGDSEIAVRHDAPAILVRPRTGQRFATLTGDVRERGRGDHRGTVAVRGASSRMD